MSLLKYTDAIAADESQGGTTEWLGIGAVRGGGRSGGGLTDSLIVLSQKMLGYPGEREREDYQEINFKTGLALLTSQGSAVQCPHGTWLPIQTVITADLV